MYESSVSETSTALNASNSIVYSDDTISRIVTLSTQDNSTINFQNGAPDLSGQVTVAAGAEVLLVTTSDTSQTTVTPPQNVPVVIFQGQGGVNVTFNDGTTPGSTFNITDRVVVGSAGNDRIVVADTKNTFVTLGAGNSTVTTGDGYDTVVAGLGNSTIVGGSNHSIVQLRGNASDYTVAVQDDGHVIVTHTGDTGTHTDISKIQFVQLDNQDALVFAANEQEAAVTSLYHTAFGRTADSAGLQYWFDRAAEGMSLNQIANLFTNANEFGDEAAMSDADFVQSLYEHTFNRAADSGGLAYWLNALSHNATRGDLIAAFAEVAGQQFTTGDTGEATIIGHVTVIPNIV